MSTGAYKTLGQFCAASMSLALATAAGAQETGLLPAAEQPRTTSDGEIVVTARKRSETMREIPETISVMSSEALEQREITTIDKVGLRVTNLNLSTRADGNPNVTIRGVGSFGNTQGVGFFIDGVQIFTDAGAEFGEIERLEVLKGPQGTLYGGSNIGGAIRFITKRRILLMPLAAPRLRSANRTCSTFQAA